MLKFLFPRRHRNLMTMTGYNDGYEGSLGDLVYVNDSYYRQAYLRGAIEAERDDRHYRRIGSSNAGVPVLSR